MSRNISLISKCVTKSPKWTKKSHKLDFCLQVNGVQFCVSRYRQKRQEGGCGVRSEIRINKDYHAFLVVAGIGSTPSSCLLTKAKSPYYLDKVASYQFYIDVR